MTHKLSTILPHYRHYQPDQVLTHTQLNETISYFEDQGRLTRIGLIGVGIVNGLDVVIETDDGQTVARIGQGYGITTDGDLVHLQKIITPDNPKEKTMDIENLSFTHFREFRDENAVYRPFFYEGAEQQVSLLELCQEEDEEAVSLNDITDIDNRVFLIYIESYPKDQDICGDINCDNQGIEQIAKLRYLMVEEGVAQKIVAHDPVWDKFSRIGESLKGLTPLHLLRTVHLESNSLSQLQIDKLYREAILQGNTVNELKDALQSILSEFSFLLDSDEAIESLKENLHDLFDQHFSFQNTNTYQHNQYRYSLLRDILETYTLLLKELFVYDCEPNPDIKAFPKHLMLGIAGTKTYRHSFYKSPAISDFQGAKKRTNRYLRKIYYQLNNFDLQPNAGLRLAPSVLGSDFRKQKSIPFYYKNTIELRENWSTEEIGHYFSYHYELGENPLLVDHPDYDFYSIGGHLGAEGEETYQALKGMVNQFGLDFQVYHFDLVNTTQSFRGFLRNNSACRHLAGVSRSGTYILLSVSNRIIGDLALPYRVEDEISKPSVSHIKVAECTYPWISTLKYINNLSRSLRGTRRRVGVMPTHYRLVVREYEINGFPIINGPVTLLIPLESILYRRMHAITEALNERFPKGLVFDFNENLKRFVIIRPFDDEFSITMADTTISFANPAFTYTHEGMFKSDNIFRLQPMRCDEKRRYRESTYMQLHGEFAPINKDDDYGSYKGRWEEWYRLIEVLKNDSRFAHTPRIPRTMAQLPVSVRRIIEQVRSDLIQSQIPHVLYLTGDWVNGSWASEEMIASYGNISNTNDPIFRFLRLRRLLHHKEGATKPCLFVVLDRESNRNAVERRMEKWTNVADIYIEGPSIRGSRRLIDNIEKLRL